MNYTKLTFRVKIFTILWHPNFFIPKPNATYGAVKNNQLLLLSLSSCVLPSSSAWSWVSGDFSSSFSRPCFSSLEWMRAPLDRWVCFLDGLVLPVFWHRWSIRVSLACRWKARYSWELLCFALLCLIATESFNMNVGNAGLEEDGRMTFIISGNIFGISFSWRNCANSCWSVELLISKSFS